MKVLLTSDQLAEHLLMHRIEGLLDIESLSQWSLRRLPTQLPTLSHLYEFLELRASTLLAMQGHSNQVIDQKSGNSKLSSTWGRSDERRPECKLCIGERHMPFQCLKFKAMTMPERTKYVEEQRMCHNCFSTRHVTDKCPDKHCPRCRAPHNSNLCPNNPRMKNEQGDRRAISASSTSAASSKVSNK